MRTTLYTITPIATALAVVLAVALRGPDEPAPRTTRDREITLLEAQRFDLAQPHTHYWRRERPLYRSGWLLVFAVDRERDLTPRQTREPVLFVGTQTAERVNTGAGSGRIVAIVPGDFLLVGTPVFFGEPALPEEIDANHIERELAGLPARGARVAMTEVEVEAALRAGVTLPAHRDLHRAALDVVARHAPDEQDLLSTRQVERIR